MNVVLIVLGLTAQQPQDTALLRPIVVTATRVPIAADMVAAAVTVLRGADLEAQGIRTVAQAMQLVPGASVIETGSFGGQTSLFVRGGESDYVKVLLDGVPLNQPGGAIDLAHLTTDNVERIEIVRGPVSVLYGSDAMTGVVQIFTRAGKGASRIGADVQAGSYGSTRGALDVQGGTGRLGYAVRASRFAADGLYPYNNQYRNSVVSARIHVTPDAHSDASVTYRYGDDVYHFPTNGQGEPVDSNQRAAERGPLISLNAGRVFGDGWEARLLATGREARLFYNDEPDSPGEDGTFWSRDYVRRSTLSPMLTWRRGDLVSVTAGVEYEDQRQRGRNEFSASFGTFPDSIDVRRHNVGYFTQGVLAAGRSALTLGGRLDDNSQFGSHSTYRIGLVYRLAAATRLRVAAGTGFKEPTFFENFASGFVRGNPDLKPERSRSWEAGVEHSTVGNRASLAVTYFNQRFRDLIEYYAAAAFGAPNYFNVGGAIADGVETNLSAAVASPMVLSLRYTYLHTVVKETGSPGDPDGLFAPGKPLLRRPAHTVVPQLTTTVGNRVHLTLAARWVGKRADRDFSRPAGQQRITLPAYTRVNLASEYDLGRSRASGWRLVLTGSIDNAFNDQSPEISGFRPRGRTIMIGGRLSFGL